MAGALTANEEAQLAQTIEMFEVITQSQPLDYQSLEILKEAYLKLGRQRDVINTSKRIAQAYVHLGQLSSAILEYESILQQFPDDPDVKNALAEIESKAGSFSSGGTPGEGDTLAVRPSPPKSKARPATPAEIDDGRGAMARIFVEGKLISSADFSHYWHTPNLNEPPGAVVEPFIQTISEKGLIPIDRCLKILTERSRLPFLPLEKYDIDVELARSFSKELCQRWCLLPFDRMSKSVMVATANPFNKQAIWELESSTKSRLLWYLSPPGELTRIIRKLFR